MADAHDTKAEPVTDQPVAQQDETQTEPAAPKPAPVSVPAARNWASILTQPSKPAPRPLVTAPPVVTFKPASAQDDEQKDEDEVEVEVEAAEKTTSKKKQKAAWKERPSLVEQHQQPKRTLLVLDTGALIKGVRLDRMGSEFWTIQEVLDEVRDTKARDFLNTFPYEIKVTEPAGQDLKAVVDFAKKTGDYASLSITDMKVIALTRMFEREHNGADHLRATPPLPTLVPRKDKKQQQQQNDKQWGGAPPAGGRGRGADAVSGRGARGGRGRGGRGRGRGGGHAHGSENVPTTSTTPSGTEPQPGDQPEVGDVVPAAASSSTSSSDQAPEASEVADRSQLSSGAEAQAEEAETKEEGKKEENAEEQKDVEVAPTEQQEQKIAPEVPSSGQEETSSTPAAAQPESSTHKSHEGSAEKPSRGRRRNKNREGEDGQSSNASSRSSSRSSSRASSNAPSRRNSTTPAPWPQASNGDDDEGGWITPDNIDQMKRSDARVASLDDLVKRTQVGVACITTDYAMQNVLIQMGLHLLSTEGLVIKKLRTYLLQCHACFKTTKEMDRVFCANCGHQTLRKVPYVVDERTGQPILLANRISRPVSVRGTKFSLPLPKGGRHEQKVILREDELLEKTRRRKKKTEEDAFDEDKGFLQPRQQNQAKFVVGGKTRRNPNESRHRTGKRKKNSGGLN